LIFFKVDDDFNSVETITQQKFSGIPVYNDGVIFPTEPGYWESENVYAVTLGATCNTNLNDVGNYHFNLQDRTVSKVTSPADQPPAGNLGMGTVHGKVTDTAGSPIANATVICGHQSYASPAYCAGVLTTSADGTFAFMNVFFHDTDTIYITVEAPGFESKTVSQAFFTTNDWEANVVLNRVP
jgi:hypothetical protein